MKKDVRKAIILMIGLKIKKMFDKTRIKNIHFNCFGRRGIFSIGIVRLENSSEYCLKLESGLL